MSKKSTALGLGLAVWCLTAQASLADNSGMKALHGHVPAVVKGLTSNGEVVAGQKVQLAIGLPLRNTDELTNLLQELYDPSNPNYQHYLTPDQFTAKFGPSQQDYDAVINFAKTHGLQVVATHPNRMLLDVAGKASDVEHAFNVTLKTYHHPTENRDFFAPDVEPSVPANLSIQDISGLDNFRAPHSFLKIKPGSKVFKAGAARDLGGAQPRTASPYATTGSGPQGNYIGNDFRNAYVPGTPLNGSGQTIGLVQFDGYLSSDIQLYESVAGRTNIPLQNVLIDGFNGQPTGNGGEVEVSLDIEMCVSMAPALKQIIVYEGNPNFFIPNDVLNAIATANAARQISCSWGWTGGPQTTTDQIFQQMAVQGQTFFASAGDGDAYPAGTVDNPFSFGTPADDPYITSVGGTTLTMNGTGASYSSETVWNWDIRYGPSEDGVGSSGAISTVYTIPYWQTNINMTAAQGSSSFRNMPDVALTADDTLVIADGGLEYTGVGGTSVASPLWAGFTSLLNQQQTNNHLAVVGFLNPSLYKLAAQQSTYTNCFHDIVSGNNEWSGSPNLFSAVPGYDLCTGLGTPNGTNLLNAFLGGTLTNTITHVSAPPKPYGTTLSVMNGSNPNGPWNLFIMSDTPPDTGAITNGWSVTLVTANPVGYAADSAVGMSASASSVLVNQSFSYYLTVTNYGPSTATNVLVNDTLPASAILVSSNVTLGSITRLGSTLLWNVATNLPAGTGGALTLTMQDGTVGIDVNTATVTESAGTPDPNPYDDTASASVTVGTPTPPSLGSSLVLSGNKTFEFTINSTLGKTNIIQVSTNLTSAGGGWQPIYTNTTGGTFLFNDTQSTNYPIRFYRDIMLP